jgi:hypothetical protein
LRKRRCTNCKKCSLNPHAVRDSIATHNVLSMRDRHVETSQFALGFRFAAEDSKKVESNADALDSARIQISLGLRQPRASASPGCRNHAHLVLVPILIARIVTFVSGRMARGQIADCRHNKPSHPGRWPDRSHRHRQEWPVDS